VTETEMWRMAASDLGRFGVLDFWMFKPQAEMLVTGSCFTGEREKGSEFVRLAVGPQDKRQIDKKLFVFGNRKWTLVGASEPDMFSRMPVDYAHAFGGEGFDQNPVGRGMVPLTDETGAEYHPLPNVEDPKHVVKSKGDRPAPASFAAWDLTWPHHFKKKMGTYGFDHVDKNGFSLADDIDFSLFNVAAPDQRVEGYFNGDEEVHIENMHPDRRILDFKLPGYAARCLLKLKDDGSDPETRTIDVAMKPDTIHVFPHRERCIVMFRGVAQIGTADATDVEIAVAALEEGPQNRKTREHYEEVIRGRLDKERGALRSLRDRDLIPASAEAGNEAGIRVGDPLEDVLEPEGLLAKNAFARALTEYHRRKDELIAQGVDPALIPPPPQPPTPASKNLETLPDLVEDLEKQREEAMAKAETARREMEEQLRSICDEHGLDLEAIREQKKKEGRGPPKFSAEREIAQLEELAEVGRKTGVPVPGVQEKLDDPNFRTQLLEAQQHLYMAYRLGAHFQDPADAATPEATEAARDHLTLVVRGAPRGQRDFTGVDLSGLDLSGVDLEGAFLEGAKLVGTNLERARLRDAVLAHADLTDAKMKGADLERANLGRARLRGADLTGARMVGSILYEAELTEAKLVGADLTEAQTLSLNAEGADFSRIVAKQLVLYKANLKRTVFRGARVTASVLLECDATEIDCGAADFSQTAFVMTKADGANFLDANAENFRMVSSSFENSDFRMARMPGSNLRGAKLAGSKMTGANLRRSDLSTADMRGVDLSRGIAVECIVMDTNLEGANLNGVNLMLAIMHRANVRGADISGANLFCADLTGAQGDKKTSFAGSNVKRALVAGVFHG
jgi:uncharacterized protein YjbI with pentapeptide repeats